VLTYFTTIFKSLKKTFSKKKKKNKSNKGKTKKMASQEDCEKLLRIEKYRNLQFLNSTLQSILLLSNIEELKNKLDEETREEYNKKIEELINKNDDLLEGKSTSSTSSIFDTRAEASRYYIKTYLGTFSKPTFYPYRSSSPRPPPVDQSYFASLFPPTPRSPPSSRENTYDNSNYYDDAKEKDIDIDNRENIVNHILKRIENLKSKNGGSSNSTTPYFQRWINESNIIRKEIEKYEDYGNPISYEDVNRIGNALAEAGRENNSTPFYYDDDKESKEESNFQDLLKRVDKLKSQPYHAGWWLDYQPLLRDIDVSMEKTKDYHKYNPFDSQPFFRQFGVPKYDFDRYVDLNYDIQAARKRFENEEAVMASETSYYDDDNSISSLTFDNFMEQIDHLKNTKYGQKWSSMFKELKNELKNSNLNSLDYKQIVDELKKAVDDMTMKNISRN
jgi:hypothetical protein